MRFSTNYSTRIFSNNFFSELRWGDIFLLISLGLLSFYVWNWNRVTESNRLMIEITHEDQRSFYPLDENLNLIFKNDVGENVMSVQAANNQVWVKDSDCPLQYCVLRGAIENIGQWIACLPNKIFIQIQAAKEENNTKKPFSLDATVS